MTNSNRSNSFVKAICELVWLKKLIIELEFEPEDPMKLFWDNKVTIDISHNWVQHDRTKNIEVDRYFVTTRLQLTSLLICLKLGHISDRIGTWSMQQECGSYGARGIR